MAACCVKACGCQPHSVSLLRWSPLEATVFVAQQQFAQQQLFQLLLIAVAAACAALYPAGAAYGGGHTERDPAPAGQYGRGFLPVSRSACCIFCAEMAAPCRWHILHVYDNLQVRSWYPVAAVAFVYSLRASGIAHVVPRWQPLEDGSYLMCTTIFRFGHSCCHSSSALPPTSSRGCNKAATTCCQTCWAPQDMNASRSI